ncbi:sugar phosphate isomerase/epimerase family protein [Aquirufa sp. ROCK2-A2]
MKLTKFFKPLMMFAAVSAMALFSFKTLQSEKPFGGLALYTVRDAMNKEARATLEKVAQAGYVNIESAGYNNGKFYNLSPADFKALLDEMKLTPISAHQGSVNFENVDQQIADLKAVGFKYFVIPVPPMNLFYFDNVNKKMAMKGGAKNLADILTKLGEKCKAAGLELLYHNHDFEFVKDADGNVVIDYLLENCDPKLVNFQMDLYWVTKAGADPVAYFKRYPGRFKIWHVKDMDEQGRFAPVGNGSIDFKRILANKKLSGMKYYYVEQDACFNETPLEAIKISHKGLSNIGFK